MGWSIGYDSKWKRDIGYGVPCVCDHPDCDKEIDRGLSYVCGSESYGGEYGCGLYFCEEHKTYTDNEEKYDGRPPQLCDCCLQEGEPFKPKPDTHEWINWKLTDESWQQWRDENPEEVKKSRAFWESLDARG